MLMVLEAGYECHFITADWFKGVCPDGVVIYPVLKNKDADQIVAATKHVIWGLTHVFTHDVAYLNIYRAHDEAIRRMAEAYPEVRWLHWSHSAPNLAEPKRPIPNSTYIGMNRSDIPLLAEQYNVPENQCQVVYNSVSPDVALKWHPLTTQIVYDHDLLSVDFLAVLPLDMGRFEAKGGHKAQMLFEKLRAKGKDAKIVVVNAASNREDRRKKVEQYRDDFTIFTSDYGEEYRVTVPRQVVLELFQISNVFPLLSLSEGCSLTMLEAGLGKNLVILNEDFPPMREFGGIDHVMYMKTGSTRYTTKHEDEHAYYSHCADRLIYALDHNPVLKFNRKVLKRFNRGWIWKNQLEPLL
jgi:hypothetical protein